MGFLPWPRRPGDRQRKEDEARREEQEQLGPDESPPDSSGSDIDSSVAEAEASLARDGREWRAVDHLPTRQDAPGPDETDVAMPGEEGEAAATQASYDVDEADPTDADEFIRVEWAGETGAAEADMTAGEAEAAAQPRPGGYRTSGEHLRDELARIDLLVRAQTARWRLTIADHKPEHLWGMVHVTDAEVQGYLDSDFILPPYLPADLEDALQPYWAAADDCAAAIKRRLDQTPNHAALRLHRLMTLYDLSPLDKDILLTCLLPDLDERYRRLYGYLQDDASRMRPSIELILQIVQRDKPDMEQARAAFLPQSPLLAAHLVAIESEEQADSLRSMRTLRLDERAVDYLLGGRHLDGRLHGIVSETHAPLAWHSLIVDEASRENWAALARWWQGAARPGAACLLHGAYGSGRLACARAICTQADTPLLVADAAAALQSPHGFERVADLTYREARLRGAAVYWSYCEQVFAAEQPTPRWEHLVSLAERAPCLTFLASHTVWDPTGRFHARPFFRLDFPMPAYELRVRLWLAHLPSAHELDVSDASRHRLAAQLANGFQLTEGQIIDAVAAARHIAQQRRPDAPRVTEDDLYAACRRQSGRRLVTLARRVEPRPEMTVKDLVLPRPNRQQLGELRNRIHYRSEVLSGLGFERRLTLGKGLIALFTGSSGTGKTMAAQLLASQQGVDLYKIDMSAVVSKYVGETEKNLGRVFAEAEDSNAILFFDEADALFGKRGKVEEARDRWANQEVNYLLQRIEEYSGVVILATNLRQNIDDAFIRRIHVIVDFPFPEEAARYRIWLGLFPQDVARPPRRQIRVLAQRFRLAGGAIQNIVIDATFRARAEGMYDEAGRLRVTMRHLVLATAREYQKLGQPLTRGLFGEDFYPWVERGILGIKASGAAATVVQHG